MTQPSSHPPSTRPSLGHPAVLLATWFGSGWLPKAPGTWGSLAALPCAAAIAWFGGPVVLLCASALVFLIGIWAGGVYAEKSGEADPSAVVIDEVAGQWLALVPVASDWRFYAVAFLAFRLCDIYKPWPANWLDRHLKGGLGIMADDMVAGAYAMIVCYLVSQLLA